MQSSAGNSASLHVSLGGRESVSAGGGVFWDGMRLPERAELGLCVSGRDGAVGEAV